MTGTVAAPQPRSTPRRVVLLGNPNTGKTTLFNRLCGLRAKTANFPGTTSELRLGRLAPGHARWLPGAVEIVDLPGVYSVRLALPESEVASRALAGDGAPRPDAVVVIADATNLVRNLMLVGELARFGVPTVVALNMMDLARRRGLSFDAARLAAGVGAPVVPVSARSGEGIDALLVHVDRVCSGAPPPAAEPAPEGREELEAWAERIVEASVGGPHALGGSSDTLSDRLDATFTHPIGGVAVFLLVMGGLFWTIFALATVPMDLIEATFLHLGGLLESLLPAGAVRELLVGGLIGGVAGTVVFLPQICLLFFLITLLEDTGYLARAAFVMDRLLCRFGLPGYAFVPLISTHACAIPGILSAKLIPDRNDRLATILVSPFMSCSARLPVYVLLTGFLFQGRPAAAGLAFIGCYLLGSVAAFGSALVVRRTILPGRARPMVLELPSYKWPSLRVAVASALEQGWAFLRTVGTVILALCFVMWWLSAYPKVEPPAAAAALEARAEALEGSGAAGAEALRVEAARLTARHQQEASFAGRLGRLVAPAFEPLGYDWRLSIGVLSSFAAREVFVSTLAVLVEAPDEGDPGGVLDRIRRARRDDGSPLLTRATAVSLLVFFVLAMQCASTLVAVRRETRHWKWPLVQLAWMSGIAYLAALVSYHGMRAFGIA